MIDYALIFLVGSWPSGPLGGFAMTIIISALALAVSFPIATVLAIGRWSGKGPAFLIASIWVYAFRAVPLIMIVFWAYYLIPVFTGVPVSAFTTGLCGVILYESAYLAEVIRAGIQGLPKGQMEAARSIGLSYRQALTNVVLPQALMNMLPSIVNQFISTIKATAILYIIGVNEATFAASQVSSIEATNTLPIYLSLAFLYFVACFGLSLLADAFERRRNRLAAGGTAIHQHSSQGVQA